MSDFVSADEAQKLLDDATPGPWEPWERGIDGTKNTAVFYAGTELEGTGYMTYESPVLEWGNRENDLPLIVAAPDLARTVIAQAEQIKRLQAVIQEILPEYNRLDVDEQRMEEPHQEPQEATYKDLGLKQGDME